MVQSFFDDLRRHIGKVTAVDPDLGTPFGRECKQRANAHVQ